MLGIIHSYFGLVCFDTPYLQLKIMKLFVGKHHFHYQSLCFPWFVFPVVMTLPPCSLLQAHISRAFD